MGFISKEWGTAAVALCAWLAFLALPLEALAHGITLGDKGFIQQSTAVLLVPSYVGEPECNGVAERFMRTLKEDSTTSRAWRRPGR